MRKREFRLNNKQVRDLINAYVCCKDGPTRTRYLAVRMYGTGYPVQEIMSITSCSRSSLMDWCRQYREEGVEGLVDGRKGGNRAKLGQAQIDDLRQRLRRHTPRAVLGGEASTKEGQFWSLADLKRAVRRWYGVSYRSSSSYHRLFDMCGFDYQRAQGVYRQAAG